jgi:hypothetical protein
MRRYARVCSQDLVHLSLCGYTRLDIIPPKFSHPSFRGSLTYSIILPGFLATAGGFRARTLALNACSSLLTDRLEDYNRAIRFWLPHRDVSSAGPLECIDWTAGIEARLHNIPADSKFIFQQGFCCRRNGVSSRIKDNNNSYAMDGLGIFALHHFRTRK